MEINLPKIFFNFESVKASISKVSLVITTMRGFEFVKQHYVELLDRDTFFLIRNTGYPDETVLEENLESLCQVSKFQVDLNILVFGGGATLDYGKVVASELIFKYGEKKFSINLLLIPSNSGSAAEVTNFCTIWNYKLGKKISYLIAPEINRYIFYDTAPLATLKRESQVIGILDSLSHAFDSRISKNKDSLLSTLAEVNFREGISALSNSLTEEYTQEFERIQLISLVSGICIATTKTSLTHALSYGLTLTYGYPHGIAVGVITNELIKNFSNKLVKYFETSLLNDFSRICSIIDFNRYLASPKKKIEIETLLAQVDSTRLENSSLKLNRAEIISILENTIQTLDS